MKIVIYNKQSPLITALYLPQYYETDYNNKWWGKGYTEWVACKKAKPLFRGHKQPKKPLNNNYYDLSKKENIRWQIDLAKRYGIDGFAIYQYYSCGKKLLEIPTEMIRDNKDLDIPFYLFWANESWRKMWFGQDRKIVWKQEYGNEKDWYKQFLYCLDYFKDERYIRIDGKPVYGVYNAFNFHKINEFIDKWNEWAQDFGLKGIYFIKAMGSHDRNRLGNFSAIVSREPNYTFAYDEGFFKKALRVCRSRVVDWINRQFLLSRGKGIIELSADYDELWGRILKRRIPNDGTVCLGAFTDWDNSPRKSYNSTIISGGSPEKFGMYMQKLYEKAELNNCPMIVINAWNEWAEGAYLEPDELYGYKYLEQIIKAKKSGGK